MVRRARLAAIVLASLLVPGFAFAQVAYPTVVGAAPELGGYTDAGAVQMYDDGTHGDAVAGDGIWTTQVTLAPPTGTTGAWSTEYKIEPPNHVLNDGKAIGQAPQSGNCLGIPLNFPAAQSYTVEFRYADNTGTGWMPAVSVSDSWNTGWSTSTPSLRSAKTWVVAGGFQALFGGTAWDPSSTVTVAHDDGTYGDQTAGDGVLGLGVMTSTDFTAAGGADTGWKIALQGTTPTGWTLKLGTDGWNVNGNSQGDAANGATDLNRWQPVRYEVDLERGAIQAVPATSLYGTPEVSEIVSSPSASEFVEIYNPADALVSLDGVYLADDQAYDTLPASPTTTTTSSDFDAQFPAGAFIDPHAFQTVTTQTAATFNTTYGANPTYALQGTTNAMRAAWTGSIGTNPGLTNTGEFVALFTWQTGMPLVEDLDIAVWGPGSSTNLAPVKTDVAPVTGGPAYGTDAGTVNTSVAGSAAILARKDFAETGELLKTCTAPCTVNGSASGNYNGVYNPLLGGREDETSEPLANTWYAETTATPGAPNGGATYTVTGVTNDGTGAALAGVTITATQGATTQTATSGASGNFSLTLGFGSWSLSATKTGYTAATASVYADHDQALPSPLVLTTSGTTYTLTGTVTDASTTNPISGATISVSPGTQTATTGASGTYTLTLPANTYSVTASATGYASSTKSVSLTANATQDFALTATTTTTVTVSGTVDDGSGNPLANVSLGLDDGAGHSYTATSGSSGTFSFTGVAASITYTLTATLTGYTTATQQVQVGTTDKTGVTVTMTATTTTPVTVSGTVKDAAGSVLGNVSLGLDDGAGTTYRTTSAGDGTFSFTGVNGSTSYTLTATLTGYATATQTVAVTTTDKTGVAVTLTPLATTTALVSGTVTDGTNPLASVALVLDDGAGTTYNATSATDGTFSFPAVNQSTTYTLTATLSGYNTATQSVAVTTTDKTGVAVTMTATTTTTVTVSGTVTDGTNPLANVTLGLDDGAGHTYSATSAADGTFSFTGVAPSITYTLTASLTGYNTATKSVPVGTTDVTGVAVTLTPTTTTQVTVSGTVADASSAKGIAGAALTLNDGAGNTFHATSGTGGTFSFSGVNSGTTYTLTTLAPGYAQATQQVQVQTADVTGIAVTLTAATPVTVSGTVTDATTTNPVGGASLTLDDGAGNSFTATSDATTGAFSFTGVTANDTYTLTTTASGYQGATQQLPVATTDVTAVAVSMTPTGTTTYKISGTVSDGSSGNAIAGATVSIASPAVSATTDSTGKFSLTGLPNGTYTLQITATGYQAGSKSVTVNGADVTGVAITLSTQASTYTLSGTVSDGTTQQGINGATVTLTLPDSSTQTATTSGGGLYSFSGLAAGRYDLSVTASGYQQATATGIQVSGDTTQNVSLTPTTPSGFKLSGTVHLSDRSSGNWSQSKITLVGQNRPAVLTKADGSYEIVGVPAGSYQVQASHPGYTAITVTVKVSKDTTQDFVLVPAGNTGTTGCSCSAAGGSPDPLLGLLFLGLGMAVLTRRRRRG